MTKVTSAQQAHLRREMADSYDESRYTASVQSRTSQSELRAWQDKFFEMKKEADRLRRALAQFTTRVRPVEASEKYWTVARFGGTPGPVSIVHKNRDDAIARCKELATKNSPQKYVVLEAVMAGELPHPDAIISDL